MEKRGIGVGLTTESVTFGSLTVLTSCDSETFWQDDLKGRHDEPV